MNIDDVVMLSIVREKCTGDVGTVVGLYLEDMDDVVWVSWHARGVKLWIHVDGIEPVEVTDEIP